VDHGHLKEEEAWELAARLGVRDFVYLPKEIAKGSATREISDGLLVAGGRGLILQVKSRDPGAAARETGKRAAAWATKQAADAISQAAGSRRRLAIAGDLKFVSMRGLERTLPSGAGWPAVVIIDHPSPPSVTLPAEPNAIYITMNDWMNLYDRLRSTAAVIDYVHRAIDCGLHPRLGAEQQRYDTIADLDAEYAAERPGALPIVPQGRLNETALFAVAVFDELMEKVADPTNEPRDEANSYLHVVELLDRQPILFRATIGTKMINKFKAAVASGNPQGFAVTDRNAGEDRLVFYYDVENLDDAPDIDEGHIAEVSAYGALRHTQALESGARVETRTLAVGIRHNPKRGRRYAFALYDGLAPPMSPDFRRMMEAHHGILDVGRGRTIARTPGRNELCVCGSGRKYKHCCSS